MAQVVSMLSANCADVGQYPVPMRGRPRPTRTPSSRSGLSAAAEPARGRLSSAGKGAFAIRRLPVSNAAVEAALAPLDSNGRLSAMPAASGSVSAAAE